MDMISIVLYYVFSMLEHGHRLKPTWSPYWKEILVKANGQSPRIENQSI